MPSPLQGYTFDPRARGGGQYRRGTTGRFVSRSRIIDLMERSVAERERGMIRAVEALSEKRISVNVFSARTEIMLQRQYLQMRALGKGGWDRLTPSDYAMMNAHIQDEIRRMNVMARELADGKITLKQAMNRMHMYLGNARANFYEAERQTLGDVPAGTIRVERRHLGIADHCEDCLRYYALAWQAEGVLPLPTQMSQCGGNCRCSIERKIIPIDQFPSWEGQFSQAKMAEGGPGSGHFGHTGGVGGPGNPGGSTADDDQGLSAMRAELQQWETDAFGRMTTAENEEAAIAFANGEQEWFDGFGGTLEFSVPVLETFRGGILSHTHPNESSFSPDDLMLAQRFGLREIRVLSKNLNGQHVTHVMRPKTEWPNLRNSAVMVGFRQTLESELGKQMGRVGRQQIPHDDALRLGWENAWITWSKQNGIDYAIEVRKD